MANSKWLEDIRNSEVLLIYDDWDDLYVKKWILPELKKENLKFILPETNIQPGMARISLIPEAIEHSKKALIILSKDTKQRFKCTLEIFFALEKSLITNKMCITIALLGDLDKSDIPNFPMLEHSTVARLTDNDQPYTIKRVIENIRDDSVDLNKLMPAGNLATGLAWSHFLGYLSIILPELATNIIECEWFKRFPGKMSTRFFMLLPKSGKCSPLQDQDNHITHAGSLKIEIQIAGTKRVYTPNVYCIQDEVKQTHYYCCAEIPNAFGCIGKIFYERLGKLNAKQRNLEVDRFYHVLNQILNHENNKRCHMLYELITYNDDEKSEEGLPSTHILRSFHKEQTQDKREEPHEKKFKHDVCLMYGKDDEQRALYVKQSLEGRTDKPTVTQACPDAAGTRINDIEDKVKDSKWIVLLLSKDQKWFEVWIAELLCCGVEDVGFDSQDICVLPLLYNVDPDTLPTFIRWLTYIEAKDGEDYVTRIFEIIKGQRVALKTQSPVGNVHDGLVWGFVVNYLRYVLPEITERIKQRLKELRVDTTDPTNHYHTGLLEIVPQNCEVPARLDIEGKDFKIENMGRIEALKGVQQMKVVRVFACNFYKLTKDSHSYYFAGEFATPIRTLNGMGSSVICGLTADKMKKEAKLFTKKLERIMKKEEDGRKCVILEIDSIENLAGEIIDEITENEVWQRSQLS